MKNEYEKKILNLFLPWGIGNLYDNLSTKMNLAHQIVLLH